MAITKLHIDQYLELAKDNIVLDVRSPAEYEHAHIPGAYNIPLFTNEERKLVGTAYKQESREKAIKIGLDFFGPKMRKMVEEVELLVGSQKSGVNGSGLPSSGSRLVFIYCWRGGMRSAGVAWLLDLYGFKVYTLVGGYKSFRKHVLETFQLPFQFHIVGGYTGSGKTEALQELKKQGQNMIDLEALANHKGSAFGNIGLPKQPTQEMFENLLFNELKKSIEEDFNSPLTFHHSRATWLEDESQRIGLINIPSELWKTIRRSPVFFLDIPFEERLDYIVKGYGNLNKEQLINAIMRIQKRLGGLETKNAINYLLENNIKEGFRILLRYYDKWYLKGLHNREGLNSLLTTISCDSVNPINANKLIEQLQFYENQ